MGPDSVGGEPGTVSSGDLESTVDIGGTSMRGDREQLEQDAREVMEDQELTGREIDQDVVDQMNEIHANQQEYLAERAAAEAAAEAAMAEAHANGDAYYAGDTTHDGETVQEWILPDGTVILVDDDGQAVSIDYPPGEGPIYIGDITYQGEPHAVYEMPGGGQVVVNDEGDVIGELDDLDYSTTVPLGVITGDNQDIADGEMVTVTVTPLGPPSYDTVIVDAETGEVYERIQTGQNELGIDVGQYDGVDAVSEFSTYQPPGADYALVIDAEGNVVDTVAIPEEPEWSILGVVEYYEDGTVVVDVGAVEVSVDVVGPEGGISVDFDVLIAEGTAGVEWNEDGSWEFSTDISVDIEGAEVDASASFGQDAKGNGFLDVETSLDMNVGFMHLEGGQWLHVQQTDDGFEGNIGWEGEASMFGGYLSHKQELSVVVDGEGFTGTYQDTIGAGIKGLGGIEITSDTQVRTDGTFGGTSATQGAYGAVVDADGDRVVGGGVYADTKEGLSTSTEMLDDQRDYEREYDERELPATPDGGADFEFSDGSHPGDGDAGAREGVDQRTPPVDRAGAGASRLDVFDEMADAPAERSAAGPRGRDAIREGLDGEDDGDAVTLPNIGKLEDGPPERSGVIPTGETTMISDGDEPAAPWKGLPRDVASITPESRTVAPRSRDRGGNVSETNDVAPETEIPADDITTMVPSERAGGGVHGLEGGRAGGQPDAEDVAAVETAIPALATPVSDPPSAPEPELEPLPIEHDLASLREPLAEPEQIEPEPEPEPEPDPIDADDFADDLDV